MKKLLASVFALSLLVGATAQAADPTITFTIPQGYDADVILKKQGEVVPPETEPPVAEPPVAEPPVAEPPVAEPPVSTSLYVWPKTETALSWCDPAQFNVCLSVEDSATVGITLHQVTKMHYDVLNLKVKYQKGTHAVRVSYNGPADLYIDGSNGLLNCLDSSSVGGQNWGFEGQGCIVANFAKSLTIKNWTIKSSEGQVGQSGYRIIGDRTFRAVRAFAPLVLEDITFDGCAAHCVQGNGDVDWTIRRVKTTQPCSARGDGYSHCLYSSSTDTKSTMLIEDSDLHSHAGHVVKTGHSLTIIKNSTLSEGIADTGAAIHSTSNRTVILEDVIINQVPSYGNRVIFLVGPKADRCRGSEEESKWTLTRVQIHNSQHHSWGTSQSKSTSVKWKYKSADGTYIGHPEGPSVSVTVDGIEYFAVLSNEGQESLKGAKFIPIRFICPVATKITVTDSTFTIPRTDFVGNVLGTKTLDEFPQAVYE